MVWAWTVGVDDVVVVEVVGVADWAASCASIFASAAAIRGWSGQNVPGRRFVCRGRTVRPHSCLAVGRSGCSSTFPLQSPASAQDARLDDHTLGPPIRYSDHVGFEMAWAADDSWAWWIAEPTARFEPQRPTPTTTSPSQTGRTTSNRLGVRVNPFMRHLWATRTLPYPASLIRECGQGVPILLDRSVALEYLKGLCRRSGVCLYQDQRKTRKIENI